MRDDLDLDGQLQLFPVAAHAVVALVERHGVLEVGHGVRVLAQAEERETAKVECARQPRHVFAGRRRAALLELAHKLKHVVALGDRLGPLVLLGQRDREVQVARHDELMKVERLTYT